ncbi:MAG: hypothetical protein ACOC0N_00565 [Chroococcales cyanobacterium]
MVNSTITASSELSPDQPVWENLKEAIASSSGFQCWQQENIVDTPAQSTGLDSQVRNYLRETLETLAY